MNNIAPKYQHGVNENTILDAVCAVWDVSRHDLLGRSRSQPVAFARQLAMALTYNMTGCSLHDVGGIFGRNHATVIHARNVINNNMNNPVVKDHIRNVINMIQKP